MFEPGTEGAERFRWLRPGEVGFVVVVDVDEELLEAQQVHGLSNVIGGASVEHARLSERADQGFDSFPSGVEPGVRALGDAVLDHVPILPPVT